MADDGFLSRWSRRKAQVRAGVAAPDPAPVADVLRDVPQPVEQAADGIVRTPAPGNAVAVPVEAATGPAPDSPEPAPPLPTLEDVALLTHESDFRRFVAPGVDENVKRAALKTMFRAPHFNIMDGLDVYIDDYGKPDPIPESMLRQMVQSKALGLFDHEDKEDDGTPAASAPRAGEAAPAGQHPEACPDGVAAQDLSQSPKALPDPELSIDPTGAAHDAALIPDEDTDLQLQPDDAAGRSGAA